MAEMENRVSSIDEHWVRIVSTLETLVTNQRRLDEALVMLTKTQIRNQEQFRETDARIANLTSAIGQLIVEMRSRPN